MPRWQNATAGRPGLQKGKGYNGTVERNETAAGRNAKAVVVYSYVSCYNNTSGVVRKAKYRHDRRFSRISLLVCHRTMQVQLRCGQRTEHRQEREFP